MTRSKDIDEKFCPHCGAVVKVAAEVCPSCGVRLRSVSVPWYNSVPVLIVSLIVFFPVGLYALVRNETIGKGVKALLGFGLGLLWFLIILSPPEDWESPTVEPPEVATRADPREPAPPELKYKLGRKGFVLNMTLSECQENAGKQYGHPMEKIEVPLRYAVNDALAIFDNSDKYIEKPEFIACYEPSSDQNLYFYKGRLFGIHFLVAQGAYEKHAHTICAEFKKRLGGGNIEDWENPFGAMSEANSMQEWADKASVDLFSYTSGDETVMSQVLQLEGDTGYTGDYYFYIRSVLDEVLRLNKEREEEKRARQRQQELERREEEAHKVRDELF